MNRYNDMKTMADRIREMSPAALEKIIILAHDQLRMKQTPEPLRIDKDCWIYYKDTRLEFSPLARAVYLLFLRHPEGIAQKDIQDYRNELVKLYHHVSVFGTTERMDAVIDRLTEHGNNNLNTLLYRIRKVVHRQIPGMLANLYDITGRAGEKKKILLDRQYVTWE